MKRYSIYGLNILSSRPLVNLHQYHSNTTPDLVIYWQPGDSPVLESSVDWEPVQLPASRQRPRIRLWQGVKNNSDCLRVEYHLRQLGIVNCVLNMAIKQLWITHSPGISAENLHSLLLGTILGFVLRRRATLCLHASVVSIRGKSVALLGAKRAGKSTTAAALIQYQDALLIADDMAVITRTNGQLELQPGYPGLRLNPEAIEQLYTDDTASLPRVYSHHKKRYVFLSDVEYTSLSAKSFPRTIDAIYLLDDRIHDLGSCKTSPVKITPMSNSESIMQLMANTYASYSVFDKKMLADEFATIKQIVERVPIHRMHCLENLDRLPVLAERLASHISDNNSVLTNASFC